MAVEIGQGTRAVVALMVDDLKENELVVARRNVLVGTDDKRGCRLWQGACLGGGLAKSDAVESGGAGEAKLGHEGEVGLSQDRDTQLTRPAERGQVVEVRVNAMGTSGESRETLVNELASIASFCPSTSAAISAIPVGYAAKE